MKMEIILLLIITFCLVLVIGYLAYAQIFENEIEKSNRYEVVRVSDYIWIIYDNSTGDWKAYKPEKNYASGSTQLMAWCFDVGKFCRDKESAKPSFLDDIDVGNNSRDKEEVKSGLIDEILGKRSK